MNDDRCATIGCDATATHAMLWTTENYPTEFVCDECAAAYSRRPALANSVSIAPLGVTR